MPDKVIDNISGMLNEEKWTRATLNDYAIGNFQELDGIIEKVIAEGAHDEVQALCEEHLEHTKNSIVALYVSGVVSLRKQQVDDTHLLNEFYLQVKYIFRVTVKADNEPSHDLHPMAVNNVHRLH